MSNLPALSATLANKLANNLGVDGDGVQLIETLKATAFSKSKNITNEQMVALLMIANQYGLNPWTNEIYAFPQGGGIVPIVGVDGWLRIINNHPQFDGMEFQQDDEKCTCTIYRKDRNHPISVTEYLAECQRETAPWKLFTRRMLRHKAMMQCARYAFGFSLQDPDDAEYIKEKDITPTQKNVIDGEFTEVISKDKVEEIRFLLTTTKSKEDSFLNWLGIETIEAMTPAQYESAIEQLNKKVAKLQQQAQETEEVVSL